MNDLYDKLVLILEAFGKKTGIYNKLEFGKILIISASWTDEIYVYNGEALVCHFIESTNKKLVDGQWQEIIHHKSLEAEKKCQTRQREES